MRWEALFADLEAQLEAARGAELAAQVADLTRAEQATVPLVARLRGARGAAVTLRVGAGEPVRGTVVDVSDHWVLMSEGPRRALVPMAALTGVSGLASTAEPAAQAHVVRRLGLGHALRALARDRAVVRVAVDGGELAGRIERVGADHLDLALVPDRSRGDGHRGAAGAASTAAVWTVPLPALRVVRSG